jgi:hypothetical protein
MLSISIVPFENKEFSKAVSDGILSIYDNFIKNEIMSTYVVIRSVNDSIKRYSQMVIENTPQWTLTQTEKELKGK